MEPQTSMHQLVRVWNARNLLRNTKLVEWACVYPKTIYWWIKDSELEAVQFSSLTFIIPRVAKEKLLGESGHE